VKNIKLAILGATGAVGREMLKVLEEYGFPTDAPLLLASARSAGKTMTYKGKVLTVREATPDAFDGCDVVLGAVEAEHARVFAPHIVRAGALFIDNSSAFRLDPDVPLVVPEINGDDIKKHQPELFDDHHADGGSASCAHFADRNNGLRHLSGGFGRGCRRHEGP